MNISLRTRLTISFVMIILILGLIATFAGIHFIGSGIINQAQDKVRLDLNTAREVYRNRLESIVSTLKFTAIRPTIKRALIETDRAYLKSKLDEVRSESGIEMLTIADRNGRVVLRSHNPNTYGDDESSDSMIRHVLTDKTSIYSTEIVSHKELESDGKDFALRALISLVPTPKAEPTEETEEQNGMVMKAAAPLFDENGDLIGVIYGGDLLTRNYDVVDKIKDIVYHNEKYGGKDIGTATIFQNDLRISTNVMTKEGERAIGTRVWKEVGDQVLKKGGSWVGDAFVVNDWYFTAYEPIRNTEDRIIGMLYVGMLKKPFTDARTTIVTIFSVIVLLGVAIVIIVANSLAARISRPMKEVRNAAQRIADGDYSTRIRVASNDETGELARSFNKMTEKLLDVHDDLKHLVETLEEKVEERTRRIKDMQSQLIHAEKMASLGKLAAGVAHEINNPLTGILTNSSLLLEEFKEGEVFYKDIKAIVDETLRCRQIVKGLLDFARQTEPEKVSADVNEIIESVVSLVANQVSFQDIEIKKDLSTSLPMAMLDGDQIKQVLMNIVLNAAEAMSHGGKLAISSLMDEEVKHVLIKISDTGCGIDKEHQGRIFDPFFSTKEGGTGLGLSISYGIVERHGGTIEVESVLGLGSTFIVKLPVSRTEEI